jgi:Na+/melibiose symporter-like transporter
MVRNSKESGTASSVAPFAINLIYLVTFLGVGCTNAGFIAMFLAEVKGLTLVQVGIIASLKPACTFLAAPAWAAVADTSGRHKAIYTATTVGAAVCRASVLLMPGFAPVALVIVTGELIGAGSSPMLDAAVLATMVGCTAR